MDEILPFLYVGTQAAAEDLPYLSQYGVSHILNVSESSSGYPPRALLAALLANSGDVSKKVSCAVSVVVHF